MQVRALPGAPSASLALDSRARACYGEVCTRAAFVPAPFLKENIHDHPIQCLRWARSVARRASRSCAGRLRLRRRTALVPRLRRRRAASGGLAELGHRDSAQRGDRGDGGGLAVLLMWGGFPRAAGVLGVLVAAIGGTVIFEYASGIDLGIDGLFLFGRTWGTQRRHRPGRMGPPGALSWTMLGLSIVLASIRSPQWPRAVAPSLALVAMAIASLSLIGYLYGASDLYTLPRVTVIALQTSTFVLAISIGVVLGIPERAPVRLLADQTAAGELMRRLLPAVIVVPIALGLLRLLGRAGRLLRPHVRHRHTHADGNRADVRLAVVGGRHRRPAGAGAPARRKSTRRVAARRRPPQEQIPGDAGPRTAQPAGAGPQRRCADEEPQPAGSAHRPRRGRDRAAGRADGPAHGRPARHRPHHQRPDGAAPGARRSGDASSATPSRCASR